MTLKGYNYYLDNVRLNAAPIPEGVSFTFDGLDSGTDYSGRITSSAVDDAGNESARSLVLAPGSLVTSEHATGDLLSPDDQAAVSEIVVASMAESGQPGVALAIDGPRGRWLNAWGTTAGNVVRPLTVDDHFRVGSITKSFTSTAVMMAVDRGDISLDDKLEKWVPGVPNGSVITLRNMLMMRSGIPDYNKKPRAAITLLLNPTAPWNDDTTLSLIKTSTPLFPPGTQYTYTNSNFVLLGLVLKAATGRKIRDILTQDIITPLGLTETSWQVDANGNGVSTTTAPAANSIAWNPDFLGCAGGITSTVGDLIKWTAALRDHTLVSEATWNMWMDTVASFYGYPAPFREPTPAQFGYGLGMESTGTWFGHGGSWFGYDGWIAFEKNSGACISLLENKQTSTKDGPVNLATYTTIFRRVAELLYPGSMDDQFYANTPNKPKSGLLTVAPVFSAAGVGMSPGRAVLRVAPVLRGSADAINRSRAVTLTVAPRLSAEGSPAGQQVAKLQLSPLFSATGTERYPRSASLRVAPVLAATGVGHTVTPVAFDASSGPTASNSTITISHTAAAGATVVVPVMILGNESVSSITYAGTAMTQVGSGVALNNSSANGWLRFYKIEGVASGSASISISKTGTTSIWMVAAATSYLHVGSVSVTLSNTFGSGTSLSQSATSVSNGMVVQAFGMDKRTSAGTISGGNNRIAYSNLTAGSLIVNDSASSATFSATAVASATWAGAYVVLNPA